MIYRFHGWNWGKVRSYQMRVSILVGVITLSHFAAWTNPAQDTGSQLSPQVIVSEDYKLGPGDILDVNVSKNEQLSRTGIRVSNQGTIQLPMLDTDITAACLTERELSNEIRVKYKKYLVEPHVSVSVREFNSNPVAVIGAVNSPGRFQLQRKIRLIELLTFVNGPSPNAGRLAEIIRSGRRPTCADKVLITPTTGDEELVSVTLSEAFKNGDLANPEIFGGDIVRIPEASQLNAYIQGNIKTSLAINLKDPVTLTQAIAMAGGVTSGAQLEKVRIRRPIPGSVNRRELIVNLKEINQLKTDDILLEPNDIIEIPGPTGGKKVFQDIFRGIIPSLTRLPMGVIPF